MFTSILVPLDGSSFAERAIPVAVALARRTRARIELVHVNDPRVYPSGVPMPDRRFDNELRSGVHDALDSLARRLSAGRAGEITVTYLDGAIAPSLEQYIVASGPDLVVMSTHGAGGVSRLWLGSVADHLVRHSSVPVLLVRPGATGATRGEPLFRHILVPLDGSTLAERALEHAVTLATPGETTFTLLRVVVPVSVASQPYVGDGVAINRENMELREHDAKAYLDRLRGDLSENGFETATSILSHWAIASSVLQYAAEHNVDLISVATHGRGGVARVLLGSVADKILRGAETPLLIYHPAPADDSGSALSTATSVAHAERPFDGVDGGMP
jgi:nucleotide-binding universal stress UspA family protein